LINIGIPISNYLSKEKLKGSFLNKKINLIFNNSKKKLADDEIIKKFKFCDYLISGTEKYDKEVLKKLKNLKGIIRIGVGTDKIDINFANYKKIKIYTTNNNLSSSVAELALTHILILSRNFQNSDRNKKFKWIRQYGNLIQNKKIGVLGYGNIGKNFKRLILSFNPKKIYVYDKYIQISKTSKISDLIQVKSLKELFSRCDIISIHLPLNEQTNNLINKNVLNYSKKSLILVNTSRAEVLNEKDIIEHMKKNLNFKLGLDVFWKEPNIGQIKNLNNVSLSSHIGSYTIESRLAMEEESIKILKKLIKK
jgi:D-3-phosphoglycerate dehydrogenase